MNAIAWAWGVLGRMPSGRCSAYTAEYLRLERFNDLATWGAYFVFPAVAWPVLAAMGVLRFPSLRVLIGAFVAFCGTTHLLRVLTGYHPELLALSNGVGLATALTSWAAVAASVGARRELSSVVSDTAATASRGAARFARVYFAFVMAGLLAAGAGGWGYQIVGGLIALSAERRAGSEAVRAVERLASLAREAESGQRGYLLTGDAVYLQPFLEARASVDSAVLAARRGVGLPPHEVDALAADVRGKLAELGLTVALAEAGDGANALSVVRTGEGRRLMRSIRSRAARVVAAVELSGRSRGQRLERSGRAAVVIVPAAGILSALIVVCSVAAWGKEWRKRVGVEAAAESLRADAARNSELMNTLSHDLRTPLQTIRVAVGLARRLSGDPLAVATSFEAIDNAVKSQSKLLDAWLTLAKSERSEPAVTRFGPQEVLEDVYSVCGPLAAAKGLAYDSSCPHGLSLSSDRGMITQALMNLVDNAVKFTVRGRVTVNASPGRRGAVVFTVTDNGPGLPATVVTQIGRDFVQGDNAERDPRKGFGLGLAIAHRVAVKLGGKLSVPATGPGGTVFSLELSDLT